jgi:hypothetical protein
MHWILHFMGLDNASGPAYLFWSGIFGDLSIFGGVMLLLRKHNCHRPWCLRIGTLPEQGTTYVYCRRHHSRLQKIPRENTHG